MVTIDGVRHNLSESSAHLRLLAVANRLDQEVTQGLAVELQLAQHIEDLTAQRSTSLFELLQERAVNVPFAGLFGDEVPEVTHLRLADAVDAPEALLDAVGVPRHIVVHHKVRPLEVDPFTRRVRRQKHLYFG